MDVEHDYHDSSSVAQKQNLIPYLFLKITAIAAQHCLRGRGLKGQARGAKRDHSDEIGG